MHFLGYFTSLEALSLGVRIGSSRTDGPYSGHTRVPSKLKRFELSSSPTQNYQYILEWLLTADISLETIGLYLYWNHEQEALLSSLLNAHSQTLTTLKLDLTSCSPDSRLPVSFFNLGQKPSLQCLELTGIHTEWDISRGMGFLQDLLCSFSHQSLIQRISLSFARQMDIITALKDVDWVRFAHALEGPAFTDLKTLHIQYSGALRSNEAQSFRNIVTSGLLWLEKGGALIF
ncbi:hypothetical protein AX16_007893 [Volvariella volvacea WC 439]|nr:hypothetical protein AX16_007893 [Volvariella volvacea WC 439]